ncbi:hypothetical protein AAZX31_01G104100 [Glycine max]
MANEWRLTFRMLICPLDGQWNHDPWFKEDNFVDNVRFGLSPVVREPYISPFYFDLPLVLTQYPMLGYMCVSSTPFSSPSRSSSSASSMADIVMMIEEIFAQPIVREYVLSSLNNEIPLLVDPSYNLVSQTRFLLSEHLIDWSFVLEDYVDGANDKEDDPSKDASDARETPGIDEDSS